jgi:UDP-N-acetylglucosamine pyrophosphorylase
MDSFNTDADTRRIVQKYTGGRVRVLTFKQSRYPRILKSSLLPAPSSATDDHAKWYTRSAQCPHHCYNNAKVSAWTRRHV